MSAGNQSEVYPDLSRYIAREAAAEILRLQQLVYQLQRRIEVLEAKVNAG